MSAHSTYPLSPLQQGMLFHALAEPRSGVDIEQLVFTLREPVEAARLRVAWERVVARHDILRTAFRWDGAEPLQEVKETVEVQFGVADLADEAALAAWLHQDRARGFEMGAAPLLRFQLFRLGDEDWRLVWTFHHALLDGRSFPPLIEEAFRFYDAPESVEPPAPRPYRDFIEWHRAQDFAGAEAFWRKKLQGFRAPTPLAIDGLGALTGEREQGDAEVALSVGDTTGLRAFAEELGVTLNTLVQGAWAVLLHRYSGEEDVCFGATRAARRGTIEGAEEMIGLFINTVPVRVQVGDDRLLADFLRELREGWVVVRPHEHTPLARVQAWSEVPPGKPLFRTLVVFENYDLATHFRHRSGAWERREMRLYEQTNFPICLAAYAGDRLRLVAEYDRSRLDDGLVRALLGHVQTVLEAMPAVSAGTLGDLPLLQPKAMAAMLEDRSREFPAELTLHAQFSQQAAKTPEAVALVQGETRMTYAELEARANAVARRLAEQGVRRASIVGLCLERCPELVVGLLGILKANAAYLPIDLAYPPERLAFMLEDAHAPVLLTQRHLADRLPPGHGAKLVFIEDIGGTAPAPTGEGTPEQLCYVLYTSGSTGKPKGCCITHRNVGRLFTATEAWFSFNERDVWTLFHSTAFDFSVWELWGALLHGGTLVVVPFEVSRSPEQFHELLVRERVTVLNQTPSAFRQLMAADEASPRSNELHLRTVVFGGEALEMATLQPWFARHGDEAPLLVNMYGITETTVHVTYRPLQSGDVARGSVIGREIPDLQLLVLDSRLRPVPVGVAGELFVGGAGLARGYHQRPELTASRFVPHPAKPGARLYRTGDLARRLPDGELEYLGRIDQQVKIRGFRIELGEIESVLLRHPRIREAAVLARPDEHGGKKLIAWVVENPEAPAASNADLRAHLKGALPDYMLPAAFVRLPQMPLTNNGKLDARALPAPPEERSAASEFVGPRNETERALVDIWQRVLKVQRVGVHDNFFELGGDSILTILVVSQARQRGLTLTPKQLFDRPTVAELAAVGGMAPAAVALPEEPAEGEVPLTPIQRWFFAHEFPDAHHWNQSLSFRVMGEVSAEQMARAFQQVVSAHPVFRLRYERTDGGWRQFFGALPDAEELEFHGAAGELQCSLKLSGPLLRYSYKVTQRTLAIAMHHLIVDGVSWRVLLQDLDAALRGAELPRRTTGFHTWAKAMTKAVAPVEEKQHWDSLGAVTETAAAGWPDFPAGGNLESHAHTRVIALGEAETERLRARGLHEVLLAATAESVRQLSGSAENGIEVEGHGREEALLAEWAQLPGLPDLSHTIGWFTIIHPLQLSAGASPEETLQRTSAALAKVPRKGFGAMLGERAGRHPAVLFNYLGHFDHTTEGLEHFALVPLNMTDWHAPAAPRTHAVEINCLVVGGRLEVRVTYSQERYREETIGRMAETMKATLLRLAGGAAGFAQAKWSEEEGRRMAERYPNAQEAFPLTPMQQLFLSMEVARPGSGSEQWRWRLLGQVDGTALRKEWDRLVQRHGVLRSSYAADLAVPHQIVQREASVPWELVDLRRVPAEQRARRLADYVSADAGRPFDLARAPLTRMALLQLADEEHVLVWTHHHLEIDGWSWPILLREWDALLRGESLPPAPQYREHVAWLAGRPSEADFWRSQLAGLRTATPLPIPALREAEAAEVTRCLSGEEHARLVALARELKVTANVLLQAAWAQMLAHHAGLEEVIFGSAFSGRPPELPGAEAMVGHFVNNLPVRVRLPRGEALPTIAQRLHRQIAELAEHQYTPLPEIQACSELAWNERLFSTLVVYQNYLGAEPKLDAARLEDDPPSMRPGAEVPLRGLHPPVRTNYPLTLVVTPGDEFVLTLVSQAGVARQADLETLVTQLITLVGSLDSTASLAALTQSFPRWPAPGEKPSGPRPFDVAAGASTAFESAIAEIWKAALGREVAVTENFFDAGGYSLLMLRVHARLAEKLAREIPVVTLFQHPTIRSLARALGEGKSAGNDSLISAAQDRAAKARAALARRPVPLRKS